MAYPGWGGPNASLGSFHLEAEGDRTRLRFTESTFGKVAEAHLQEKEKGWAFLFDGALKAHVEGRPAPVWHD